MKRVDWTFIKPLYEAGALSVREIARQYAEAYTGQDVLKNSVDESAIRKHAKNKAWTRRLADKVRERVRELQVREDGAIDTRGKTADTADEETVVAAAGHMLDVMRAHRKDIAALVELEKMVEKNLAEDPDQVKVFAYQGKSFEHKIKIGTLDRAKATELLTRTRFRRIQIERLAWGIDEKIAGEGPELVEVNQYMNGKKG